MDKPQVDWNWRNDTDVIESAQFHEFKANIVYDHGEGANPRDADNLGEFVCDHPRYILGDRELESDEEDALGRGGWPLLVRYLRMVKGAVVVLPLWLYDHSGISISAGQVDQWDSGQVGFAFVTKERIAELGAPPEDAEKQLRGEIEEYDSYLRGEVYGYEVKDTKTGETLDSCWGFVGDLEYVKEEAEYSLIWAYKHKYPIAPERERVGV